MWGGGADSGETEWGVSWTHPGSALVLVLTKANKRVSVLSLARNQLEDKSVEKEGIQGSRFESIINEFWIINHSSLTVDYWGEAKGLWSIIKVLWREWMGNTSDSQSQIGPVVSRHLVGQRSLFHCKYFCQQFPQPRACGVQYLVSYVFMMAVWSEVPTFESLSLSHFLLFHKIHTNGLW